MKFAVWLTAHHDHSMGESRRRLCSAVFNKEIHVGNMLLQYAGVNMLGEHVGGVVFAGCRFKFEISCLDAVLDP